MPNSLENGKKECKKEGKKEREKERKMKGKEKGREGGRNRSFIRPNQFPTFSPSFLVLSVHFFSLFFLVKLFKKQVGEG